MSLNKNSTLSNDVMKKIHQGNIKMKPRIYYTLMGTLSISLIIFFSIASSYLINIIILWVRIESSKGMAWGARANLAERIDSFPIWTVPIIVFLSFASVWLISKQGSLYKIKKSVLFLSILIISLLIALLINYAGLGESHKRNYGSNEYSQQRGKQFHKNELMK